MSIQLKVAFWYLICSLIQKGISVIFTPVFTRLMSTSQYGVFNTYSSWKDIFVIIITLKLAAGVMGPGLINYENDNKRFSSNMYFLTTVLVALWSCIFILFSDVIQRITGLSSIMLLIMLVQVWTQAVWELWAKEQRIHLRYRALVAITLTVAMIRPLLGIVVVINTEYKAYARIIEMTSVDLVAYFGLFALAIYHGKSLFSKKYWKYAFAMNIPLIPHFLSQTVLNSSDRIMIERLVDASASGIYSLAYSISIMTVFLNNAILQAMSPWTFRKLKNRDASGIAGVGYGALLLISAVNLIFIAMAPELVWLFAPSQYSEAYWIIPPIAMSVFFQFSYLLFADVELYFEKTKHIAIATASGAVLNVILNYVCIKMFGYYAAGYTTLICYAFIAVVHYFAMKNVCKQKLDGQCVYPIRTWLILSIGFLASGFSLFLTYQYTVVRYIVILIICLGLFAQRKRIKSIVSSVLLSNSKNHSISEE